jgi:hypothetical protein
MAVSTYYFDASDAAIGDPNSKWTNDANAADGNTATSATSSSASTNSGDYIEIDGTNAGTNGPISQVRGRAFIGTTGSFTNYVTLSAPGGGWSWAAVQGLETRSYYDPDVTGKIKIQFYADGTAGGATLATTTNSGGNGQELYRIEVEVTYDPYDQTSSHFYLRQGFQ